MLKGGRVHRVHHGWRYFFATGNEESGLRKSIARIKCLAAKATRRKGRCKALEGVVAHRLRTIKGYTPATQIKLSTLFRGDLSHTQVVGKVRPPACGNVVA